MPFVLDASTALAWFLPGQRTAQGDFLLQRAMLGEAIVPALWIYEVSSVLLKWWTAKLISAGGLIEGLHDMATLPVVIAEELPDVFDIVRIGQATGLTGYDAAYLQLAVHLDLPLATYDEQMKAAANSFGVPLVTR